MMTTKRRLLLSTATANFSEWTWVTGLLPIRISYVVWESFFRQAIYIGGRRRPVWTVVREVWERYVQTWWQLCSERPVADSAVAATTSVDSRDLHTHIHTHTHTHYCDDRITDFIANGYESTPNSRLIQGKELRKQVWNKFQSSRNGNVTTLNPLAFSEIMLRSWQIAVSARVQWKHDRIMCSLRWVLWSMHLCLQGPPV